MKPRNRKRKDLRDETQQIVIIIIVVIIRDGTVDGICHAQVSVKLQGDTAPVCVRSDVSLVTFFLREDVTGAGFGLVRHLVDEEDDEHPGEKKQEKHATASESACSHTKEKLFASREDEPRSTKHLWAPGHCGGYVTQFNLLLNESKCR